MENARGKRNRTDLTILFDSHLVPLVIIIIIINAKLERVKSKFKSEPNTSAYYAARKVRNVHSRKYSRRLKWTFGAIYRPKKLRCRRYSYGNIMTR